MFAAPTSLPSHCPLPATLAICMRPPLLTAIASALMSVCTIIPHCASDSECMRCSFFGDSLSFSQPRNMTHQVLTVRVAQSRSSCTESSRAP
jgi:hypothetical protein